MATPNPTPADLELCSAGAVTIPRARDEFGLGRSFLYEQIAAGNLRTIKRGRRRLIPRTELARLLAENLAPAREGA